MWQEVARQKACGNVSKKDLEKKVPKKNGETNGVRWVGGGVEINGWLV